MLHRPGVCLLLASLWLSGCSLLFRGLVPDGCDPATFEASCTGSVLTSCQEGFVTEINCGTSFCDAAQSACIATVCGDGVVEGAEECDDANADNTDDCLDSCVAASCGDSFVQANVEECDDGNLDNTDECPTSCLNAFCGDGFTQVGVEECDDANVLDTDGCRNTCALPVCGDSVISLGEQCDDGNTSPGDGCDGACQIEAALTCGDGTVNAGEQCDDGNTQSGDGCESNCALLCAAGTGAIRATRDNATGHCYAGFTTDNTLSWQQAALDCEALGGYLTRIDSSAENDLARAASIFTDGPWIGFNDVESEAFADPFGFLGVDGAPLTFHNFANGEPNNAFGNREEDCVHFFAGLFTWNDVTCVNFDSATGYICEIEPVACGDGVAQEALGEQCDDGNTTSGDGCAFNCLFEPNCGNAFLDNGETCDDGNTTSGDGCTNVCQLEPGHFFESEPNDDGAVSASGVFEGNDFSAVNADIVPSPEIIIHGSIGFPGDEDVFVLTNAGANPINISIRTFVDGFGNCPEAFDTVLIIRDATGAIVDASDDEGLGFCSLSSGTLLPGETIFVQILDFDDQGNLFDYLIVSSACGDGNLDIGEECDDANQSDEDGCSALCRTERCGDNAIQATEECDDGNTQNGDGCQADCTLTCGNGVIDAGAGEECDDNNSQSNDGCSADCQLEAELFVLCDGGVGGDGTLANPFHSLTDALQGAADQGAFVIQVLPQSPLSCAGTGPINIDVLIIGLSDIFAPNLPTIPTIDGGTSPAVHATGVFHVELFALNLISSSAQGTARVDQSAHLGLFNMNIENTGPGAGVVCTPATNAGEEEGALMLYGSFVHDAEGGGVIAQDHCRGIIASSLLRANGTNTGTVGGASVLGANATLVMMFSVFDQNTSVSGEGALHCDVGSSGLLDSSIVTNTNGTSPISAACTTQFTLTQGINTPGAGNLNANPLFGTATPIGFFDYGLQAGSPCIDAGNPTPFALPYDPGFAFGINPFSNDAVFDFRPQGGGSDLGLFEDF